MILKKKKHKPPVKINCTAFQNGTIFDAHCEHISRWFDQNSSYRVQVVLHENVLIDVEPSSLIQQQFLSIKILVESNKMSWFYLTPWFELVVFWYRNF